MKQLKAISALLLFGVLTISCSFAQSPTKAVRIYSNYQIEWRKSTTYNPTDSSYNYTRYFSSGFNNFTPSFSLVKENGNFKEFEITRLDFGKGFYYTDSVPYSNGSTSYYYNYRFKYFGLRYSQFYQLFRNKMAGKIRIYLGYSGNLIYTSNTSLPTSTRLYKSKSSSVDLHVGAVPKVNYYFNDHLFADLSAIISLADFSFDHSREFNPNPTFAPQVYNESSYDGFPARVLIKAGIGYVF